MTFGQWLKHLRAEKKLTLQQVGDSLGITRSSISNWEQGLSSPGKDKLPKLARLYGVSLEKLLMGALRSSSIHSATASTTAAEQHEGRLPYLDAGQIPAWLADEGPAVRNWMHCPAEDVGPRAFVTVVQGIAMAPQVEDGAFVFVDPDQRTRHGALVLVLLPQPAVRQLQTEGDMRLLAVTGRDWPGQKLTPMPDDAVIAGAVVGKWVPA